MTGRFTCRCGCETCAEQKRWLEEELGMIVGSDRLHTISKLFRLSAQEARLLNAIYVAQGKVVGKQLLNDSMGGPNGTEERDLKIVDVLICKLRRKGAAVATQWGVGYYAKPELIEQLDRALNPLAVAA